MIRDLTLDTNFGPASVTCIICNTCASTIPGERAANWLKLSVHKGNLDVCGDFCSIKCLQRWLEFISQKIEGKLLAFTPEPGYELAPEGDRGAE